MSRPTNVVGRRVGAFFIDLALILAVNFLVFFAMADKDEEIGRKVVSGEIDPDATTYGNITIGDTEYAIVGGKFLVYLLILLAIGFLYHAVLQGITGWTLGKLATGVRTVDERGNVAGVGRNAVRWLCLVFIDSAPWFIPYIVGFVCILATDKKRRVGDMLAKTAVVGKQHVGEDPYPEQAAFSGGGYYAPQPSGFAQPQPQPQPQPEAAGDGAGWHPDPHGQARLRYWDGSRWTEHTSN